MNDAPAQPVPTNQAATETMWRFLQAFEVSTSAGLRALLNQENPNQHILNVIFNALATILEDSGVQNDANIAAEARRAWPTVQAMSVDQRRNISTPRVVEAGSADTTSTLTHPSYDGLRPRRGRFAGGLIRSIRRLVRVRSARDTGSLNRAAAGRAAANNDAASSDAVVAVGNAAGSRATSTAPSTDETSH